MRKPKFDMEIFKQRRKWLAQKLKGSALIVHAHPEYIRNNDVHYAYRQDSNLFYLTGFEEPESIMLFRPGLDPEFVMFVRPRDKDRETWDGFRFGPDGVMREFGADKAFLTSEFSTVAPDLLRPVEKVYYRMNFNTSFDRELMDVLERSKASLGRSGKGLHFIGDPQEVIGEMRLRKSDYEAEVLKRACAITSQAHIEVMKHTKPGVNEKYLYGIFLSEIYKSGSSREGYNGIFATGNNATTLHYVFNDCECKDGELILVDAGGEYDYYTSDITRTYPVNGKFTDAQAKVYDKLLTVQKDLVQAVKPGKNLRAMQTETVQRLTELMLELGLLKGKVEDNIKEQKYRDFYPHNLSHWLGSDVHDVGLYYIDGEPRDLEPGMCFTIEPGIYIPANHPTAPVHLRGIGIRIEDDILVTETGNENLTAMCPKEIKDLERVIGSAR